MRSILFPPIKRLIESSWGLILAFVWGAAEALFWPILPDFLLFAVVPAAPRRWWMAGAAGAFGSVLGGVLGFVWADASGSTAPLEVAPLITAGMIEETSRLVSESGSAAVLNQPLSGIPYKVFVYISGAQHQPLLIFVWASLVARSVRIFAVAGVAGLLGRLAGPRRSARYYDLFLVAFTAVFIYGLWRVVTRF